MTSESPRTITAPNEYSHLTGREAVATPSRFLNRVSKYKVFRSGACVACGKCAELCQYGVHILSGDRMLKPREWLCIGDACKNNDFHCIDKCPEKALSLGIHPLFETLGDARWPAEMLLATWVMAETGDVPADGLEYQFGRSGGGFDKLVFDFDASAGNDVDEEEIDLSIDLNRRDDDAYRVTIDIPVYGGKSGEGLKTPPMGYLTEESADIQFKEINVFGIHIIAFNNPGGDTPHLPNFQTGDENTRRDISMIPRHRDVPLEPEPMDPKVA